MTEPATAPPRSERPATAPPPAGRGSRTGWYQRRRTAWSTAWRTADPVVGATVVAFFLLKLAATAGVAPSVYPDGASYRTRGSWLDFSLTSLDGRSVRPWGVTIFMALWPGDRAIAIAQALLSFVVWAVLAFVVARGIRWAAARRVTVVLLLLIPCTAQIANWDAVMQGDSVSISTGVLALAMLLHFAQVPTWGRAAQFVAAALWFSMTRPNVFVVLVVWALGLAVIGLVRRQVVLWGAVAAALVLISLYSYVYNVRSDQGWIDAYGYSRTTVGYAYPVGKFDPVATQVIADLRRSDAPRCMIPPQPQAVTHLGTTYWAATTARACPGMDQWAMKHWTRWWGRWLLHHPRATAKILQRVLPSSLSPSVWGTVNAPVPNSVSQVFFGSMAQPQDAKATRSYHTEPALAWLAAAIALALVGARRVGWRRGRWTPDAVLGLTVVGALGSAVSSALIIQTVPFEVAQESLAAVVLLTASLVAAVGLGADRTRWPVEVPAAAEERTVVPGAPDEVD